MEKLLNKKMYNTIVLSGGAIRGFGLLGALQYLQDIEDLKTIHRWIGTSIGSLISYLMCIGYTPIEMMVFFCQKGLFERVMNVDIAAVLHGGGAISFSVIQEMIEKLTIQKIQKYITFKELYDRFQKELVVCVYNTTLEKNEYISRHTHPDMNCITALRMSCSLPFVFEPFFYDGCHYIDGGIGDNFPISQVAEDEHAIGIHIVDHSSSSGNEHLLGRIYSTLLIPIQRMEKLLIQQNQNKDIHIIRIVIPAYMSLALNISNTEKFDMFSIGYETIKKTMMTQTPEN
jgi:predicted acylesterase/phospholipase RssA